MRCFYAITLFVKKTNHRFLATLDLIFFTDVAMKGFGGPKKIEDREMIVDRYNPKDSTKFKRGDKVKITVPRTTHLLPKKPATPGS